MVRAYDAVLIVSFGGPQRAEDVLPFLENVLRGRNVPHERMLEVAEQYEQFGGVSPLNAQNRALAVALGELLAAEGPDLRVYLGNRNWHPYLADSLREMADDGVRRALAFVTSAYSSYSSCRQYLENIADARRQVGPRAPQVDKLRAFYNHPGFIEPMAERLSEALNQIPTERRSDTQAIFTAHSIPVAMATVSSYAAQLQEACRLVSERAGHSNCRLVFQSRSGPPSQPWLEPDVCDHLRLLAGDGRRDIVVAPIGFLSDHMEVLFDLDTQARAVAQELGLNMVRAGTVGTHPRFVRMIRELILERTEGAERLALGEYGPSHDDCPSGCCMPVRPPAADNRDKQ